MNKIISIYFVVVAVWLLSLSSCTDLTSTYEAYQGNGEIAYAGKLDSIKIKEGYERVQINGWMRYAKMSKSLVVEWDGNRKEFDLEPFRDKLTATVIVEGLGEGIQELVIYTISSHNVRSIVVNAQVNVYGSRYRSLLTPIPFDVAPTDATNQTIEIKWGSITDLSYVKINYEDSKGTPQEQIINYGQVKTLISDYMPNGKLKIASFHKPKESSLDYVEMPTDEYIFPSANN